MTFILSQMILEYSQEPFCVFLNQKGFFPRPQKHDSIGNNIFNGEKKN